MPKAENKSWSSLHLPPSHGILNLMNRHQFFSNRTSPQELRSLPHLICIRRTLGLVLEKLSRFFPLVNDRRKREKETALAGGDLLHRRNRSQRLVAHPVFPADRLLLARREILLLGLLGFAALALGCELWFEQGWHWACGGCAQDWWGVWGFWGFAVWDWWGLLVVVGRHCDWFVVEDGVVEEAFVGVVEGRRELW
jgi:hypothetical protein